MSQCNHIIGFSEQLLITESGGEVAGKDGIVLYQFCPMCGEKLQVTNEEETIEQAFGRIARQARLN